MRVTKTHLVPQHPNRPVAGRRERLEGEQAEAIWMKAGDQWITVFTLGKLRANGSSRLTESTSTKTYDEYTDSGNNEQACKNRDF